jgi:SAM-dependent methyltransferase
LSPAFVKEGHVLVRCPVCGLLRRATLPAEDEVSELYDLDYFCPGPTGDPASYVDYLKDQDLHRLEARKRLRLIESRVGVGSLLDVGCAAGFLVDEARRRGWTAQGVDVSEAMTAWGRSNLDVPVQTLQFSDLDLPSDSMDAVTMWDYIEHSTDPLADVTRARTLLRPGGVLALSTGDIGSFVARVSGVRWHLLTPRHHLFYFDRTTLRLLVEKAGLELVECRIRWNSYSLRHLAHKLRSTLDVAPLPQIDGWVNRSRIGGLAVPLTLGDIVTVVARRGT